MSSNDVLRRQIIKSVMTRRYPDFLKWKKPVLIEGIGPCHPTVCDEFDANVQAVLETALEILNDMSFADLETTFTLDGRVQAHEARLHERMLQADDDRIRAMRPVWFAGGFSVVGRAADDTYWTQMKRWDLLETVALSLGYEPCGDILEGAEGRPCQSDVLQF